MIDVGGPSMLRAAAKNFTSVVAVCRPQDYGDVLAELRERKGKVSLETRRRLAGLAFASSAAYESAIARWFQRGDDFPETFVPAFDRVLELAYGENPHQRAAFYAERGHRGHVLSRVDQLAGKPLSFNNLNDLSAARLLVRELEDPACVIVKHANPCGVAVAETIDEAYANAVAADPVSAYGGVVALNRAVTASLGEALAAQFIEVLFAPGYDEQAMQALSGKASVRILNDTERRVRGDAERDYKRVLGGLLVQERDCEPPDRARMEVVCGRVSEQGMARSALCLAGREARHVECDRARGARADARDRRRSDEPSRRSADRGCTRAELGHDLGGAVLASDAFFPFADGPQIALEAGVAAIIQPGGSKRDGEVTEAVSAAGAAMVFTHRRHFRH